MKLFDNILDPFWGRIADLWSGITGKPPIRCARPMVVIGLSAPTIISASFDAVGLVVGPLAAWLYWKLNGKEIWDLIRQIEANLEDSSAMPIQVLYAKEECVKFFIMMGVAFLVDCLFLLVNHFPIGVTSVFFFFSGACYMVQKIDGGKSVFTRAWGWIKAHRPHLRGRHSPSPSPA